jgi:YD repeat-containing protein
MVTQSSGAAIAGTPESSGSRWSWLAVIDPIRSFITRSKVGAQFIDSADRFEAMHAPAPIIKRPTSPLESAHITHTTHPLRPRIRRGTREIVILPARSELDPRHRRLDPLAMRRSTLKPAADQADQLESLQPFLAPLRAASTQRPQSSQSLVHKGGGIKHLIAAGNATTGIEHWWTYEERAIPGIGKAILNVGTGNLVVAATDVDIHEQGIDLAFQRVYNSQSLHNYGGGDGGDPAIFGNQWTNNFDANIVYNSANGGTITVYDLDGTACTYTPNGSGTWQPCTGEHATLAPTDGTDCAYVWTKTDGTVYWFNTDNPGTGCGISQAKTGHIEEILGRNQLNNITFAYSYAQTPHTSENVSQIVANHSDGQSLTMDFGPIPGTSINELGTITRPDGAVLQYSYDTSGNLLEVDKPGNNSAFPAPQNPDGDSLPSGDVPETYTYTSGTSLLASACGPRCTISNWNDPHSPTDGAAIEFAINSSLQLTSWQVDGVLNFTPSDVANEPLDSGLPTTWQSWYTANFIYGHGSGCSTSSTGTTTMCDTDGHGTIWTIDSSNRVTQSSNSTGTAEGLSIVTNQGWDTNNDLTSTTDANGNVAQYGYVNGNAVEVQQPNVSDIYNKNGSYNPIGYYSYDSNNNVTSYCDQVYNEANGNTWNPNPTASMCPSSGNGIASFTFATPDPNEPFGCLTAMQKPGGYTTTISYWQGTGKCGVGLPATVEGASITQYDQSTRRPIQDLAYDGYGNLSTYDKGMGAQGLQDSWTLSYNKDNVLTQRTNNDAVIAGVITSMSCYYPDGSLFYTETPSQWANDNNPNCPTASTLLAGPVSPPQHATAYYYNADGDQIEAITHKGCSTAIGCNGATSMTACTSGQTNPTGTTCKYYDGLDRLVETAQPYDTRFQENPNTQSSQPYEFFGVRWVNRYIYDLSQEGGSANLSISDSTGTISNLVAYGGLYKTQECLPANSPKLLSLTDQGKYGNGSCQFEDVRGNSFDGLGRTIGKYELAYGTVPVALNTYDSSGQYDLLHQTVNAVNQTTTYTYDSIARVKQLSFGGPNPKADGRQYTFDADGRTASIQDTTGFGTVSYTYDVDGNKLSTTEPSGEASASIICDNYYLDGSREYESIGDENKDTCGNITSVSQPGNGGIRQNQILSYSYQQHDGMLASEQVNWNGNVENFTWAYTPSERETTQTDPLNNQVVKMAPYYNTTTTLGTKQYKYDSYGRVSQLIMPEGFEESSFVYDGDDELVSYQNPNTGGTRQLTLDVRGEVLAGAGQIATYSASGTQVGDGNTVSQYSQEAPNGEQFDIRSGMITAITNPFWNQGQGLTWGLGAYVLTYDGAGRQTTATQYSSWPSPQPTAPGYGTTYDGENHIATTSNITNFCVNNMNPKGNCTNSNTVTATWGPDGRQRVAQFGNNGAQYTAHWEGDEITFSTSPVSLTGAWLYIGKLGIMDSSGDLYVADSDQTGEQQSSHGLMVTANYPFGSQSTGAWYNGWPSASARNVFITRTSTTIHIYLGQEGSCGFWDPDYGQNQVYYNCPNFTPTFAMLRSDGYNMAGGLVQGARTFDMTSNQWLTPDAYAGDVSNPASQKPFMYNNNNPDANSDPSGYDYATIGFDSEYSVTGDSHNDIDEPEEQAADRALVNSGRNSFYTVDDAAYAAAYENQGTANSLDHADSESQSGVTEVAVGLYGPTGNVSIGPKYLGGYDPATNTSGISSDQMAQMVSTPGYDAMWHAHPSGTGPGELFGHIAELESSPAIKMIYTSVGRDLYKQWITGSGTVLPAWGNSVPAIPPICKNCLP